MRGRRLERARSDGASRPIANPDSIGIRSYFLDANLESANRLLRMSSPSLVRVYSTRGGISANSSRFISPARSSSASLIVRVDELISSISLFRLLKRITLRSPIRKRSLKAYFRPMICTRPVVEHRHSWRPLAERLTHPQAFSSGTLRIGSFIAWQLPSYQSWRISARCRRNTPSPSVQKGGMTQSICLLVFNLVRL